MSYSQKFLLIVIASMASAGAMAQSWNIGGNAVNLNETNMRLGIIEPNNKNIVFVNGSSGGVPVERGRITNAGLWAIGTQSPNARLHINVAAAQTPFRVQINSATKLYVNSNGGVGVGTPNTPPQDGLLVSGNIRIGSGTFSDDAKLQVLGGADVTLNSGGYFVAGPISGKNIAIDDNEIMARDNGQPAELFLNGQDGGINFSNVTMVIANGDNHRVGIATGNPQTELHILHESGSGATNGLRIQNAGANDEDWTFYTQNNTGDLTIFENGNLKGSFDKISGIYSSLSDARFKKNIEKAGPVLNDVLQLDIKKYHFQSNAVNDKKHYGLLAQEVEKHFPEVVELNKMDDGKEIYSINYSAFGVLAIKAIQEQQQQTESQQKEIAELKQLITRLVAEKRSGNNETTTLSSDQSAAAGLHWQKTLSGITLEQNTPNPFQQATTIKYQVPHGTAASIVIYNSNGSIVKTINANGLGTATLYAGDLSAGNYMYSLVVDGKAVVSKKMIRIR